MNLYIPAASLVLAAYWFRYACRVLFATPRDERRWAAEVAERNWLGFPALIEQPDWDGPVAEVCRFLARDYRHLMYLADCEKIGVSALERTLAALDYRLMEACFRIGRRFAPTLARYALNEMLGLLLFLSDAMGRRLERGPLRLRDFHGPLHNGLRPM